MRGIDLKNAFNSITWTFLTKMFKHYNFGPSFIKWIAILYKKSNSSKPNNGRLLYVFQVDRCVHQGNPLLSYLFIMMAEALAQIVQQDEQIIGFNTEGRKIKNCSSLLMIY